MTEEYHDKTWYLVREAAHLAAREPIVNWDSYIRCFLSEMEVMSKVRKCDFDLFLDELRLHLGYRIVHGTW